MCAFCRSSKTYVQKVVIGSFFRLIQMCSNCHRKYEWESQPYIGSIPAGNILTSAAILYSGALQGRSQDFLKGGAQPSPTGQTISPARRMYCGHIISDLK